MGKVICEHHGKSGMARVCTHLQRAVAGGGPAIEILTYAPASFPDLELRLCPACAGSRGLPVPPRPLEDDEAERHVESCAMVCLACFDVWRAAASRPPSSHD
ncbi:MAG: hypothetical protein ACTHU0_30215 [Kofleriaceae bacterium]